MTKAEMLNELKESTELDKKTCSLLLDALHEEIVKVLSKGGRFTQNGFGTFSTSITPEREGRNPATGARMRFPKKRKIKFKAANSLKENINE